LIFEDAELKRASTLQEMLDVLERRGEIKLHKPQKSKRVLTEQQRRMMRLELNESMRGKSLLVKKIIEKDFPMPTQEEINEFEESVKERIIPLEGMIQQEREERDEAIRL
jgi:hypothetical protein